MSQTYIAQEAHARGLDYDWLRKRVQRIYSWREAGRVCFESEDLDAHLALFPQLPDAAFAKAPNDPRAATRNQPANTPAGGEK